MAKIKDKEGIWKEAREKQLVMYKATSIRPSAEKLQTRREWHNILKMMKGKNLQPRIF